MAFKLLHEPEYGSEKNIKQVLHIVNREISRLFYPSILFYCDKWTHIVKILTFFSLVLNVEQKMIN